MSSNDSPKKSGPYFLSRDGQESDGKEPGVLRKTATDTKDSVTDGSKTKSTETVANGAGDTVVRRDAVSANQPANQTSAENGAGATFIGNPSDAPQEDRSGRTVQNLAAQTMIGASDASPPDSATHPSTDHDSIETFIGEPQPDSEKDNSGVTVQNFGAETFIGEAPPAVKEEMPATDSVPQDDAGQTFIGQKETSDGTEKSGETVDNLGAETFIGSTEGVLTDSEPLTIPSGQGTDSSSDDNALMADGETTLIERTSDQTDEGFAPNQKSPADPSHDSNADTYRERTSGDQEGQIEVQFIGDYEIQSQLGRGGMGVVYKARHRTLNREVALKMILAGSHSSPDTVARFLAEARAVAHLSHPGIVQIFDIGSHQGMPFFSLEYIKGRDLLKDLDGKPRDPVAAAEMVAKICRAMHYAHQNGILHRDLKPANILLDEQGEPKITDFGLAKELDEEDSGATREGTIMGSPSYMPPEQAKGAGPEIDAKSDQYSMGAVLYQMLSARPPFITERPLDTIMQVIEKDPVAIRELQPDTPVELETICMKALQKEKSARYENCEEMAEDLERFVRGEPILARPISPLARAWRWCRRNPRVAIPSTLAGLLICVTAFVSTMAYITTSAQAAQIVKQKKEVEEQRDIAVNEKKEADKQRGIANAQRITAEKNEELARKQAQLALDNIQYVLTEVDSKMAAQEGTDSLRIAILEGVSKKWDDLDIKLAGGIRGEAIPTLMAVRQQIALAFRDLDELTEADREFDRLYDLSAERIGVKGRTDSTRTNRAKIAWTWSPVKRRLNADPETANQLLMEAIKLVEECVSDPRPQPESPSDNEILELLSALHQDLGVANLDQGRLDEASQLFRSALDEIAKVLGNIRTADGFAEKTENERDQATAMIQINHDKLASGLAYIELRLGNSEQAIQLFDKAIDGRREIFNRRSSMLPLKVELAGQLSLYGLSLLWIDEYEKADSLIREAIILQEQVHEADPEKAIHKRMLAESLYCLGTLRDIQNEKEESLALFERCRQMRSELLERSNDEKNQINLMLAECRVGNLESGLKLSDELAALETKNGERHLQRARGLAQLSKVAEQDRREEIQTAAINALERAVDDGYSDPFRISAEHDLRPLHDDPRFKATVEKLRAAR